MKVGHYSHIWNCHGVNLRGTRTPHPWHLAPGSWVLSLKPSAKGNCHWLQALVVMCCRLVVDSATKPWAQAINMGKSDSTAISLCHEQLGIRNWKSRIRPTCTSLGPSYSRSLNFFWLCNGTTFLQVKPQHYFLRITLQSSECSTM